MAAPRGDELPKRERELLRAIIQEFIATGDPVGSHAIAPRYDLSSATVRAVMADLEALGYLRKPHASAGRVPTDKGFRLYVDSLLRLRGPRHRQADRIRPTRKLPPPGDPRHPRGAGAEPPDPARLPHGEFGAGARHQLPQRTSRRAQPGADPRAAAHRARGGAGALRPA